MTAPAEAEYPDRVRLAIVLCVWTVSAAVHADPVVEQQSEPCLRPAVRVAHFRRPTEEVAVSLTHCDGRANLEALTPLSLVGRAWRTAPPTDEELATYRREHPERTGWLTARHRRLHPGLLTRVQALVDRWPDRKLLIVSGHRPGARRGSRHRVGKALDLQIEGVERAEVARFARMLADTGVGFYPRSTFTHIDVRSRAAFWIDRSGPGQRADYGSWPGWEPDPSGPERVAQLDRSTIREGVAAAIANAVSASLPTDAEGTAPDDGPDPDDEPEVLLDVDEVRRRTRDLVSAMPSTSMPNTSRRRPHPQPPAPPNAIVRRERLPTPPVDWSVPW